MSVEKGGILLFPVTAVQACAVGRPCSRNTEEFIKMLKYGNSLLYLQRITVPVIYKHKFISDLEAEVRASSKVSTL